MLIDPLWAEWQEELAKADLSVDLETFLADNPLASYNFGFQTAETIAAELAAIPPEFHWVLDGEPPVATHHLYAMLLFAEVTGVDWRVPHDVVEWGGGYGSMCRLAKKLNPATTWQIIDLPFMLEVQATYADTDGGWTPEQAVEHPFACDIFVASCSLDESPVAAQEQVALRCNWFDCPHLLLAFQPREMFPDAARFPDLVPADAIQVPALVDDLLYAFR